MPPSAAEREHAARGDAVDAVWANDAPVNALELGRTIFRAFAKRINGDKNHYDRLFKELVDKVKEKNNKLSEADAKALMKSWKESGVSAVRRPRSSSPAARSRPAASATSMDQWLRAIRVAQDGAPANMDEINAEMDRILNEIRDREAHKAAYESGQRIVGWLNPEFTSARIMAKNLRDQYYALTDTGGVETLKGPIERILGPVWADYRAHMVERGNMLTILRERFPHIRTLYRLSPREFSEYPLDGEQLHVPWAVEAPPPSDDKKAVAAWKKRALALKAYFDNEASEVDMGKTSYTPMQDVWDDHVMLALLLKPGDTHSVISCGAKPMGAFVGFFGGEWRDEPKVPATDLFIEIKSSNKKSRYLYYDKTLNLLSLASMSHRRGEGNVRVVIKKTVGLLKGKFAVVIATKPIAMYDELVFEPNFGIHNQTGEDASKIPTGGKRLHRHAQPPAAVGSDDARGSSEAESSSSSSDSERGDPPAHPRDASPPPPAAPPPAAKAPPKKKKAPPPESSTEGVIRAVEALGNALVPGASTRVLRPRPAKP
jgi:hypothetical protein